MRFYSTLPLIFSTLLLLAAITGIYNQLQAYVLQTYQLQRTDWHCTKHENVAKISCIKYEKMKSSGESKRN